MTIIIIIILSLSLLLLLLVVAVVCSECNALKASWTVWGVLEKSTDPAAEAAAAKAHVEVFQNHSEQVEQTAKWQAHFLVTMAKGDMSVMNIMNWSLKVVSWIPWQWLKQKKGHVVSASPGARRPGCGRKIDQHHVAPSSTGERMGRSVFHVLALKDVTKNGILRRYFAAGLSNAFERARMAWDNLYFPQFKGSDKRRSTKDIPKYSWELPNHINNIQVTIVKPLAFQIQRFSAFLHAKVQVAPWPCATGQRSWRKVMDYEAP